MQSIFGPQCGFFCLYNLPLSYILHFPGDLPQRKGGVAISLQNGQKLELFVYFALRMKYALFLLFQGWWGSAGTVMKGNGGFGQQQSSSSPQISCLDWVGKSSSQPLSLVTFSAIFYPDTAPNGSHNYITSSASSFSIFLSFVFLRTLLSSIKHVHK